MRVPAKRLSKKNLVWLSEHYCCHNHTYLEHYTCFIVEHPNTSPMREKIGIFDIETTGLQANWSHTLCWCMKDYYNGKIDYDVITKREARDKNDKRIIKSTIKSIKKYDRIITWYGTHFDVPYIRSKALKYKFEFPFYRDLFHTDLYYVCRSKVRLHSNRLQSFCEYFGIPSKMHRMTPELSQRCGQGDTKALKTILLHCKEDVNSTALAFKLLMKHTLLNKRSI